MKIASLDGVELHSCDRIPFQTWRLLYGPEAFLRHGANPTIPCDEDLLDVPPAQKFFRLVTEDSPIAGGVLVDELNPFHRRAGLHVAVSPPYEKRGVAKRGLLLAGALLGDVWGFEYLFTHARPGTPGSRLAVVMGLKEQGRLRGYSLTPGGRGDMLILGGLWSDLRQLHKATLERIGWHE